MVDETLRLLDEAATEPLLVYGSVGDEARDVDVLVPPGAHAGVVRALGEAGFVARGARWARFDSPAALDLTSPSDWGLSPQSLDALFADALPLAGRAQLRLPSPHHELLVLAHRAKQAGLGDRAWRRANELAADDGIVARAQEEAAAWGVAAELAAIARGDRRRPPASALVREAARRASLVAGGFVVALSGLDGAGKSGQARALQDALAVAGIDAHVEWLPFGQNATVERASELARASLRALRRLGRVRAIEQRTAAGESLLAAPGSSRSLGRRGEALLFLWTTVVAVSNALHQRRVVVEQAAHGRIVIFDRSTVDSIVRLRYLYGHDRTFRFQSRLIEALAPSPRAAFFLDVAPETALARKQDIWGLDDLRRQAELYRDEAARLGVTRLDGERPREEIASRIASSVWAALG